MRGALSIAHSTCNLEASGFGLPRKLANARNLLVPRSNFRKSNNGSLVCRLSPKPGVTSVLLLSPPMGIPKLALKAPVFSCTVGMTEWVMINAELCANTLVKKQVMFTHKSV